MKVSEFDLVMENILRGREAFKLLSEVEPTKMILLGLSGNVRVERPAIVQADKVEGLEARGYYPNKIWHGSVFLKLGGMAEKFDGTGLVVAGGMVFAFALCEHEWDESGANHQRGWHPKRCKKCGFDASIDSGD